MKKNFLFFVLLFSVITFASCNNEKSSKDDSFLYRILVGDKYGFMDSEGNIVIEPQFDDANLFFTEGYCIVHKDSKKLLINKTGTVIKVLDSSELRIFNIEQDIYFIKKFDDKWYICDTLLRKQGNGYDYIDRRCRAGLLAVRIDNKWGYIGRDGKIVIDTIFEQVRTFSDNGLARVIKDGKHMFVDNKGNCVISVDSTLTGYHKNRAAVIIDGEKCLIDKNGNVICKLDADLVYPCVNDNFATIIKDGHASIIDTLGNIILDTDYDFISALPNGIAVAHNSKGFGLIDSLGFEIVPLEYRDFELNSYGEDIFIFHKGAKSTINSYTKDAYYFYDHKGNLIWKDMPNTKVMLPQCYPTRKDFVEYFDANISNLDPIEGIYYVTYKTYYQDRDDYKNIGLNSSYSEFYAIARKNPNENDFWAYCIDGSNSHWVNKFVKLGETNNYAIIKTSNDVNYSSEGKVTIEDPNNFDFRLETGKNNWYNFFVTYDFARDYPPLEDIEQYQRVEWTGSGFAISNSYIATNYHVTKGAKTIRIKGIKGDIEKGYKGVVVASDKENDLSVIKIIDKDFDTFGKIPYSIGKSNVEVGDDIFVLGYPLITSMGNEIKLTEGIISSSTGYKGNQSLFQISAAVQPGNSGGPLFNEEGDVVGIVCAKHSNAENANYAVKISYLNSMLEASGYNIELNEKNRVHKKKLSKKVKEIKDYVYLIECSSK